MRELSTIDKLLEIFCGNLYNYLCCFIAKASPRFCFIKWLQR